LKLDRTTLRDGGGLYRQHCMHCHGLTGDGRGPTAKWVNPHPRDYRQGIFKFQSVDQQGNPNRPPRRDDLHRTLHEGVEGTAMQSYNMLTEHELHALVSYIIFLSVRGEAEYSVIKGGFTDDGVFQSSRLPRKSIAAYVKGNRSSPGGKVADIIGKW